MRTKRRTPSTALNFTLTVFTFTMTNMMLGSFLPVWMKHQGLSDGEIGTVLGLFSISALALVLPLGVLSDFFSPRRLLLISGMLFSIYAGCILSAWSYWQFLLIAPLGGLAASALVIVLYALFLKTVGNDRVGKKIAFYQSGIYLGFGVGPVIAGYLIRQDSFEPLLFGVLGGSLLLICLILGLPDSPTIRIDLGGYRKDLHQGRTLIFLILALVYATHFGVEQTSLTLLMKENLTFSTPRIGLVYLAVGCWMAVLAPFAGHRFDENKSIRAFLWIGLAISGIFQILTPMASSFPTMVVVRLMHTVGDVLMILSMGLMTAAFFPEARVGGNSAVVYATRTCGIFAGNLASGYLNGMLGYTYSFAASGGFILLFGILAGPAIGRWLVVGEERKRESAERKVLIGSGRQH
jgi:MFS family permease